MRLLTVSLLVFSELFTPQAQKDEHPLPTVTDFVCPKYPPDAESMRLSGTVRMELTTDGHQVVQVKVDNRAHPVLAQAAIKNVRTWKFSEHPATAFSVTYVYTFEGRYKRDPVTKCDAKMELPAHVTVSTKMPYP